MTSGAKPPSSYCPIIDGFCAILKCSDCNYLYDFYEDIEVTWVCLKCDNSGFEVLPFTDYTECDECGENAQMDTSYVAKRAAAFIEKLDPEKQNQVLQNMSTANPQLFGIVQQILLSRRGQQASGFNPMQMPLPEQRPQRRDPIRRLGG